MVVVGGRRIRDKGREKTDGLYKAIAHDLESRFATSFLSRNLHKHSNLNLELHEPANL